MCILNKMKTESFECRKGVLRVSGTLIMTVPISSNRSQGQLQYMSQLRQMNSILWLLSKENK